MTFFYNLKYMITPLSFNRRHKNYSSDREIKMRKKEQTERQKRIFISNSSFRFKKTDIHPLKKIISEKAHYANFVFIFAHSP